MNREKRAWTGLAVLFVVSVLVRVMLTPDTRSGDYLTFYEPWTEYFRQVGIVQGLSSTKADYYVPLLLMYALASVLPFPVYVTLSFIASVFDYGCAYLAYLIADFLTGSRKRMFSRAVGVAVLFLPHVLINSALWKQCDSIYVFFLLAAIWGLIKERYTRAFVLLAISFSIKLQAIFLIPFVGTLWLVYRRFSILQFAWIPAIYFIAGLPAVAAGRGLRATYFTYFMQAGEGAAGSEGYGMTAFYPNIYCFGRLDDYYDTLALPAVLLTMALLLGSLLLTWRFRDTVGKTDLLYLCIWQMLTCVMFLPGMHERYDYAVVVLLTVYAVAYRRRLLVSAAVMNAGTAITYACFFSYGREVVPLWIVALLYTASYGFVTYDVLSVMKEKRQ